MGPMLRVYDKPGTWFPPRDMPLPVGTDLQFVERPAQADWIVIPMLRPVFPLLMRYPGKRFLLYTNEPRDSLTSRPRIRVVPFLPPIEIMNAFTGDVFWHNLHFLGSYHVTRRIDLGLRLDAPLPLLTRGDLPDKSRPPVAAIFTNRGHRRGGAKIKGPGRNLEPVRSSYALALHAAGLCDVYGADWPPGVSRENSGFSGGLDGNAPWWIRKLELLAGYRFNLCPENTIAPYYCTEKIWHAIQAGPLPIYSGANTIYETFPRHSFVDLADFPTPAKLIDFLRSMPEDDYLCRVNACREVFNRSIAERAKGIAAESRRHLENVLRRLGMITSK